MIGGINVTEFKITPLRLVSSAAAWVMEGTSRAHSQDLAPSID